MKKFIIITALCIGSFCNDSYSQDPVFSQPYLSPVYLNPAATGSGMYNWRTSAMIRRQWWSINSRFTYTAFSVERFIQSLHSGVGLMATSSSEGYLRKKGIHASFAYSVTGDCNDHSGNREDPDWFLTGAMQFGWVQRSIDYDDLLFIDQLNANGIIPGQETEALVPRYSGQFYPDISAGLFFSKSIPGQRMLIGGSAKHVNRPDESLKGTNTIDKSRLAVLWSINAMYTFVRENWTLTLGGNYSQQLKSKLFQTGIQATQNVVGLNLGAWYRASPNWDNPDAISLSISFSFGGRNENKSRHTIGIAHDAQIFNKKYSNTGGSSEFGWMWEQASGGSSGKSICKPRIDPSNCPSDPN